MSDSSESGLDDTQRPSNSGASAARTLTDELTLPETSRYIDLRVLGAGGMGEVRLVKDLRLEREVALKRMHGALDHGDDTRRFLREVKVQGQLDHPSVVPVYDLGLTPDGAPWFTMKRVRGQTLLSVLQALRDKDAATTARYTRWRLLSVFTTVCECIHSAHARGVLHRDLKPGNVMLGEFGEVHVLTSPLISFDSAVAPAFLLAFSLLPLITPAVLVGRVRDAMGEAERRVVIQAAALRQLVPEE